MQNIVEGAIELEKDSLLARMRGFASYCAPLLVLVSYAVIVLLWMLPVLTESKFNGVWFKKSGDRSLPDEMRVSVRKGKFKQTFWVPSAGPEEYETVTLMLDGREHKWSSNCVLCRLGIEGDSTYAAQLNGDTLSVTWRSHISVPPERTIVERFTLRNGGRELVVSNPSGETIYERASWFRALFENGP